MAEDLLELEGDLNPEEEESWQADDPEPSYEDDHYWFNHDLSEWRASGRY